MVFLFNFVCDYPQYKNREREEAEYRYRYSYRYM